MNFSKPTQFFIKTALPGLACLSMFFSSNSFAEDSIETYQTNLTAVIQKIIQTDQKIRELDNKIVKIDQDISQVENRSDLSWLARRKIVKLTEAKVTLNSERLTQYEQLLEYRNTAYQKSNTLFEKISGQIDSLLTEINLDNSFQKRKSNLDHLLHIIELRNWVIETKPLYSQRDNQAVPIKMNIQDYLDKQYINSQIKQDLISLMDEKIQQLTLMIETVREEENLRSKLEQFSIEMSSLGGEFSQPALTRNTDGMKDAETTFNGWDVGTGEEPDNRGYNNWVSTTQTPLYSSMSGYDYLPIIKDLESAELPEYLFTLDSIRTYYLDQKYKLLNR